MLVLVGFPFRVGGVKLTSSGSSPSPSRLMGTCLTYESTNLSQHTAISGPDLGASLLIRSELLDREPLHNSLR